MADMTKRIRALEKSLTLTTAGMRQIIRDFHREMERGLAGRESSLKMLSAFIWRPTGSERGEFIALDLGGTNFRVLEIRLQGGGRLASPPPMQFVLSKHDITRTGDALFGFLARSVKKFLQKYRIQPDSKLDLGFTFSFPMDQRSVASGTLVTWTKGFRAKGVIGRDVVGLLRRALAREGLSGITVSALANDTVGTLMARGYNDRHCDVGVIIGTGTNACYAERLENIRSYKGPPTPGGEMIINTEWGNFNKLRRTRYDRMLDASSDNPGSQILEKMVSGMYLGEVARLVAGDVLGRRATGFGERMSFETVQMSGILADRSSGRVKAAAVMKGLGLADPTREERDALRAVCAAVAARGARISAAAMAAVITKIDPALAGRHTIAVDGSVYEKLPRFSSHIRTAMKEIFGARARRIRLALTKDGSGKGAAIIAAVASSREG